MSGPTTPTTVWCRSCGAVFVPPQRCDCEVVGMPELKNHHPSREAKSPAFRAMQNAISEAIAKAQEARGNCDQDGDVCGADCACLRMVREELERRV